LNITYVYDQLHFVAFGTAFGVDGPIFWS